MAGLWVALLMLQNCVAQPQVLEEASRLELQGQFKRAAGYLDRALENSTLPADQRKQLEFERDRLDRIRIDFPLTKEGLFKDLKKAVRGLTPAQFEQWIAEGRFDSREIDGAQRFMVSSVSNLFWRYPELSSRRIPRKNTASRERRVLETCEAIKAAATAERKPYVLPKRFEVTMAVTAKANAAPDGKTIRAWLPIPRDYPFQGDYRLISSSSPIANDGWPARAQFAPCFLRNRRSRDQPTTFKIQYATRRRAFGST